MAKLQSKETLSTMGNFLPPANSRDLMLIVRRRKKDAVGMVEYLHSDHVLDLIQSHEANPFSEAEKLTCRYQQHRYDMTWKNWRWTLLKIPLKATGDRRPCLVFWVSHM